ncbi:uncharacterized protein LOC108594911 [Drosophila busckii]|uniref:uncharacterized protein LOC108594911 n=1 Tax=Drosophila busckii TaxID=30019 RepID=UPI00083F08FE|nr:uncharacterized protein LOC108594911 [Drosophila busckii]
MIFMVIKSMLLLIALFEDCTCKRQWEYEPISIVAQTSDRSKLNLEAEVVRVKRGEYAFTGVLYWNYDADETTLVECNAYRSNTGEEADYRRLPLNIPKQTFKQYLDAFYTTTVFLNTRNCSGLPHPDNVWPWAKQTYRFENCGAAADGMPDLMPEGYYKILFLVTGEVVWNLTTIVKVKTKIDLFG